MDLKPEVCYRAVQARDARYDGRFFTCVRTTRIYCRPVCPARPPKFENCTFVPTAAAAQHAGFRPCLRCHPESSPELDAWRGTEATVSRAMKLIESGALDETNIAMLADRLGIGERQLRRLFNRHIGAAPIAVAQTRRVLLAKHLIHQTDLSMIEIALASGFGSVRRFNEAFQRMYDRPPSELRRRKSKGTVSPELTILLPYRPPYDWEAMLDFLRVRTINGLELVTHERYSRTIQFGDMVGSCEVSHVAAQNSLQVTVRIPQLNVLPLVIAQIRRMFDLGAEPNAIASVLSADPVLAPLVSQRPGLRVPGGWDGFEVAVRAVLGQQITVRAATELAAKIVTMLGASLNDTDKTFTLTHVFPRPELFTLAALSKLGMPRSRIATLVELAKAVAADPHFFDPRRDLDEAVAEFRAVPGIGEWTAQYIAMRALGESDAFLAGDIGAQRSLGDEGMRPTAKQLLARAEYWRPWRAYALMHLWAADAVPQSKSRKKETYHAAIA